ncbi:hypothetical protein BH11BAC6_BH11BAC6_04080 [soil metagenome]
MKIIIRLFFVTVLPVVFQTGSVFGQLSGANLVANGVLAIVGGGREAKQEKIIDRSTTQQKINGSNVMVLRVKESDIKSKAKAHIIALQNRLNQYDSLYKNNQPVDIPKNDSDLTAIQNIDENWPTEYYASELKAYKAVCFSTETKNACSTC